MYGVVDELAEGIDQEDKYLLLTDMMAQESDISTTRRRITTPIMSFSRTKEIWHW